MVKFSVAMCVYKGDNSVHFSKALESVLDQTFIPDEVVLVVDGKIPQDIEKVIKRYCEKSSNLKVIYLDKNYGHGYARKIGLDNCRNNLVALMDSDDIAKKNRFEIQIREFQKDKNLSIVGSNISEFIGEETNLVAIRDVPKDDLEIKKYIKKRCPFNQMTVMLKKEDVYKSGGYLDWYCNEDYYLWIRMCINDCKFKNIDLNLVNVRVGDEMYKRRGGIKYFISEAKLQKFMYDNGLIGIFRMINNIFIRFVIQIVIPNNLRGVIFKKLARKRII